MTDMARIEELVAAVALIDGLGAEIQHDDDTGLAAVAYAMAGWPVFPLRGKVPAIPNPHPGVSCKGECGKLGHGCLDATTDLARVIGWWGGEYDGCNIGLVPRPDIIVIDLDPRHGGGQGWWELVQKEGGGHEPVTLQSISGRMDGGRHLFFRRPDGDLHSKFLPTGVDLKTSSGYVVAPPSVHPDTGKRYARLDNPIADCPSWLRRVLVKQATAVGPTARPFVSSGEFGPADFFSANASWHSLLGPKGWTCVLGDGDEDGSCWRHPEATSQFSATVRHGVLFVYSPNTPFEITEPGNPKGITRFAALAILEHNGDLAEAAHAVRNGRI